MNSTELKARASVLAASAELEQLAEARQSNLTEEVSTIPWSDLGRVKADLYNDLALRLIKLSGLEPEDHPSIIKKDSFIETDRKISSTSFDLGSFTLTLVRQQRADRESNFLVTVGDESIGRDTIFNFGDFVDHDDRYSLPSSCAKVRERQISGLLDGAETVKLIEACLA